MKNRPMTRVNLDKAIARMAGDDPKVEKGQTLLYKMHVVK